MAARQTRAGVASDAMAQVHDCLRRGQRLDTVDYTTLVHQVLEPISGPLRGPFAHERATAFRRAWLIYASALCVAEPAGRYLSLRVRRCGSRGSCICARFPG